MKQCRIVGCGRNGLRNSVVCFEHVKNPPRPSYGFAQVNTTGAVSTYATVNTGGAITINTGASGTTTGGNIIWTTSTTADGWTFS